MKKAKESDKIVVNKTASKSGDLRYEKNNRNTGGSASSLGYKLQPSKLL